MRWKWTDNNVGNEGAMKISESLMINTTLTEVSLFGDDNVIKNVDYYDSHDKMC